MIFKWFLESWVEKFMEVLTDPYCLILEFDLPPHGGYYFLNFTNFVCLFVIHLFSFFVFCFWGKKKNNLIMCQFIADLFVAVNDFNSSQYHPSQFLVSKYGILISWGQTNKVMTPRRKSPHQDMLKPFLFFIYFIFLNMCHWRSYYHPLNCLQIEDCRTRYNGDADHHQRRKKFTFPARLICGDCYEVMAAS